MPKCSLIAGAHTAADLLLQAVHKGAVRQRSSRAAPHAELRLEEAAVHGQRILRPHEALAHLTTHQHAVSFSKHHVARCCISKMVRSLSAPI